MDEDAFERLVVRCLGEMSPELRGLAVLGQNDDGKPIPCPVDGLYFIAAPEPCWVMVASTTMARQKLRGKWLGDAGDVDKAVTWFNEAKVKSPGVKGRLILATNRSLGGDDKLYLDAVSKGMNSGLEMQIVEGTALVRILDDTRGGQSVRQEILNIPASLISCRCSVRSPRNRSKLTGSVTALVGRRPITLFQERPKPASIRGLQQVRPLSGFKGLLASANQCLLIRWHGNEQNRAMW